MADGVVFVSSHLGDPKPRENDVDMMVVEKSSPSGLQSELTREDLGKEVKKSLKRKRVLSERPASFNDRDSLTNRCRQELDELFCYYKELLSQELDLEEGGCGSTSSVITSILEESNLPYCKLVDKIFEKLRSREGITLVFVRNEVLSIGQRKMYGTSIADADVLEDESEICLWCWETRDMKLLPKTKRGILSIRRTARNKIHARITTLSAMISALSKPESQDGCKYDLMKASKELNKTLNPAAIRSLVEELSQKNSSGMAEKESKLTQKELLKEQERTIRNAEKEKKRMDRELQKEKLQSEKELKRIQEEAEKEEKRREKEEADLKKQLKRQQDEVEREQKRRAKEESELKKQLSVQKQASVMQRFLSRSNNLDNQYTRLSMKASTSDSSSKNSEIFETITSSMDCAFSRQDNLDALDLWKSHVTAWHKLFHSKRFQRWGVRHMPKTELIKELKLHGSSCGVDLSDKATAPNETHVFLEKCSNDLNLDKSAIEFDETSIDGMPCCNGDDIVPTGIRFRNSAKKLLQFDKSHRPAYYGTWSKKSCVVGPHHPLMKDPDLDYEADSDEEWEEEEPGESLSDCDKDDEETLGDLKADEDDSEDSFFVPDGYLSENEGVQVDSLTSNAMDDETTSVKSCKAESENEEFKALLRQQKYLHNLTDHALRKSQPLIISNLMHEKSELMTAADLTGTPKIEQICLQALCMRVCPGGSVIELAAENPLEEDQEVRHSQNKISSTPVATTAIIPDSDLPEFVWSIQAYSHGINKVVESLQQKFPTIPKVQLKNKVREISDFVENRWQVKKNVLNRLGLSVSPDKDGRPKGIATYFSKRCLPPTGEAIVAPSSSPLTPEKMTSNLRSEEVQNRIESLVPNPT